jgi:hypothetical protein
MGVAGIADDVTWARAPARVMTGHSNQTLAPNRIQAPGQLVSNADLTSILSVLLRRGSAQLFGYLFVKLRQPRVVGEIVAGSCSARPARPAASAALIGNAQHRGTS